MKDFSSGTVRLERKKRGDNSQEQQGDIACRTENTQDSEAVRDIFSDSANIVSNASSLGQ